MLVRSAGFGPCPSRCGKAAIVGLLWSALAVAGCRGDAPVDDYQPTYGTLPSSGKPHREYSFGVVPLHNSVRLYEVFQPLLEEINRQAHGFALHLESSRDFPRHEEKVRNRTLDLTILNPYQAVTAEKHGYRIFAKMGDDDRFRGIIVVRRDAGIRNVRDLRGKLISFPAPTALAATLMVKEFLVHRGLNVERDAKLQYVGSHDSVIMNIYRGLAAAGGTWPATWEALRRDHPQVAAELEIKWRTPPLPAMAVVARVDTPPEDLAVVAEALCGLERSEEGRAILERIGVSGFTPADSRTYEPLRRFLRDYARHFGRLPDMEGAER